MNYPHSIDPNLYAFAVLFFCAGIFWSCFCRLVKTDKRVFAHVRFKYCVLMGGSVAFGLQPILWDHWPGAGGTLFAASVLIYLVCGMSRWRHGPPEDTISQRGALE